MKRIIFTNLLILVLFSNCSKDEKSNSNCKTCKKDTNTVIFCDNGDGTYTETDNEGNSSTQEYGEFGNLDLIVKHAESKGAICN